MTDCEDRYRHRIFTIPNLLSLFRLALIPLIVWLYCVRQAHGLATAVLVLSGVTDIVDGFIARRFHMISDVGKVLDPVADKLTQIAVLFSLVSRFRLMLVPLILLVLKEIFAALTGWMTIRKTGKVMGADWHGKVSTALLYATMGLHFLWFDIPAAVSTLLIVLCTGMILFSAVAYGRRNLRVLRS